MAARDEIGSRSEFIFCARIMDFCGRSLPYFRPHFLGEKAQTLDFFVELLDTGERTLFFFAQVKTTRKALTRKDRRLRVEMAVADVRRPPRFRRRPISSASTNARRSVTCWRSWMA